MSPYHPTQPQKQQPSFLILVLNLSNGGFSPKIYLAYIGHLGNSTIISISLGWPRHPSC
jgi:hypothetical protein